MILEAIVTTTNEDGTMNVSPMGPTVRGSIETFELRPFDSSRTFQNLRRTRTGVLHVTDDVEMFARSAIGKLDVEPEFVAAEKVEGFILTKACRAMEFQVEFIDETGPRMNLNCRTVKLHRFRDFWGFNRARHAVLEAAILATRIAFLPADEIRESFLRLETIVQKTGGEKEHCAFELLAEYVGQSNDNAIDKAKKDHDSAGKSTGA